MFRSKKLSTPLAAVIVASALSLASASAMAAVVCNNTAHAVPATLDGVYFNLVTGATGSTGTSVPGFDGNLYNYGSDKEPQIAFYPGNTANSIAWDGSNDYLALESGMPIGPATQFTNAQINGQNQMTPWHGGVNRYVGLRFTNEATTQTNYGWINVTTTAPGGYPANIVSWCYDNTGAAINAGTTPVSLQTFSVD